MSTRLISESGILTGLSVTVLLLAAISPVNNLFIASASALVLEVSIKRNTMKQSFFVYLATSILSFFILPYKMIAVLYVFIFGGVSLLRNIIHLKMIILKKIIMVVYVDVVIWMLFLLGNQLFENLFKEIIIGSTWQNILFFFVLQVAVLLYDYALSIATRLIVKKLKDIGV